MEDLAAARLKQQQRGPQLGYLLQFVTRLLSKAQQGGSRNRLLKIMFQSIVRLNSHFPPYGLDWAIELVPINGTASS